VLGGWSLGGRPGVRLAVLLTFAVLSLVLGLSVFAGSALAGPPETPSTEPASEVTSEAAKLHGVLDPAATGSTGTFQFLYRQSSSKCEGEGEGKTTAPEAMTGAQGQAAEAEVTGLLPGSPYTFCLQALNEEGEASTGAPVTFTTVTVAPSIVGEPQTPSEVSSLETTNETAGSADLDAKVIPGGQAKYRLEYGTTTSYSHVIEGSVAATGTPTTPVAISRQATGLEGPNKTYHWRLVIKNTAGKAESVDHTFVYDTLAGESNDCPDEPARQARSSLNLPDCRAYEMVTPPEKNGALTGRPFRGITEPVISDDGTKLISSSIQCFAESTSCIGQRGNDGATYEFARTPSGWETHPLVPGDGALDGAETYTTWAADPNLGTSLFSALAPTPGLQEDLWVREADGKLLNVGPLEQEGRYGNHPYQQYLGEWLATADLSHVVYDTILGGSAWGFDPSVETGLYEYADTGEPQPHPFPLMVGVTGGYEKGENRSLVSVCSTKLGAQNNTNAKWVGSLSQTGRTVFFRAEGRDTGSSCESQSSATAPPGNQLWARVDGEVGPEKVGPGLPEAHSVLISAPTGAAGSGCTAPTCEANASSQKNAAEGGDARDARFEAATADGSAVVFASAQQLTDNAGQDEGENLYESVCAEPCGTPAQEPNAAGRELFDVSEAQGGGAVSGGPRVLGLEALSADGSHVYFVAEGVLTGTEENHNDERAEDGKPNLYVFERDEAHLKGHLAFIARLSPGVEERGDEVQWQANGSEDDTANVTPDGRFLVFTSHRALTADDTRGEGPAQVYQYDAQAGTLTRVSVGEDGYNDNGLEGQLGAFLSGPSAGDAFIVPAFSTINAKTVPARQDPTMSDDGSFVFFQSPVALTPRALNDAVDGVRPRTNLAVYAQNFYEYHDGHVYLLASVTTETGLKRSTLLGSDVSGSNVFFGTFESLVSEDVDANLDFYDAHVCSDTAPCSSPVVPVEGCGEGACQVSGGSGAGAGVVPASEAFVGAGNLVGGPVSPVLAVKVKARVLTNAQRLAKALVACRRVRSRGRRAACEKRARARYPVKRAKHASRGVGR
jgi:hypothetical protein